MKTDLSEEIKAPEGVTLSLDDRTVVVKGEKGEVRRVVGAPLLKLQSKDGSIVVSAKDATTREKKLLNTLHAHVLNMFEGVTKGHTYRLKICSGHFPMNVSVKDGRLVVKNFLGEAVPRRLRIKEGVDVKVDGDIIKVVSHDLELAGAQASDIEQLTRITNRDRRIFQDGIYITEKNGRKIA